MIRITREVRLSLPSDGPHTTEPDAGANTWAGWPSTTRIRPYLVVRGSFAGEVDPQTGYLANIRRIDEVLRRAVLGGPSLMDLPGERAVGLIWQELIATWPGPASAVHLEVQTTPHLQYAIDRPEPDMIHITQSFEFAASHRLACPGYSDERNREVFGKCSNPNGHGHNYRLEVTVRVPSDQVNREPFSLPAMEATVKALVIERFDHKHLNSDCQEFAALNPSVEHIARVIWGLLVGRFEGATLANVRVWETAKTHADYAE